MKALCSWPSFETLAPDARELLSDLYPCKGLQDEV